MKQLTCEMCGSVDLVKQDGVYVCQFCGAKYSVEEAKKMIIDGTVEVQGTVKVDSSEELMKLYRAARNAMAASDSETALRHYENISAKDPDSWEAMFYLVILKTHSIKNGEISAAAAGVGNSLNRVFQLLKATVEDEGERKASVEEIVNVCYDTATWLASASDNFHKSLTKGNATMAIFGGISGMISSGSSSYNAINTTSHNYYNIANIMYLCGSAISSYFGLSDKDYKQYAVWCWKKVLEIDEKCHAICSCHVFDKGSMAEVRSLIENHSYNDGNGNKESPVDTRSSGISAVVLGILGIVFAWVFALVGHIISIIGIVLGVRENNRSGRTAGLVVSIVGEVCAIVSSVIGMASMM